MKRLPACVPVPIIIVYYAKMAADKKIRTQNTHKNTKIKKQKG